MNRMYAALLLLSPALALAAPEVGKPAPDFSVVDTPARPAACPSSPGRPWCWNGPTTTAPSSSSTTTATTCRQLQRRYTEAGVAWLTVISSAPGKQGHVSATEADELTRSRQAAPSAVLLDPAGDMGRAYDARVTPHMYVIDGAGILRYMGGIDSIRSADVADIPRATPYVVEAVDAVLAGEPVPNPVTAAYGCTVKY
jgi:hypothetical protein